MGSKSGNLFCPQDKWLQQLMYSFTFDGLESDMMTFCEWLVEGVKVFIPMEIRKKRGYEKNA